MSTDSSKRHSEQESTSAPPERVEKLAEIISRSQHGYRELIDNLDQALFTLSLKGEIRVANLRLAEILGVSFAGLIGHSLSEFVESPTLADIERSLPVLLERGTWSGTIAVRFKRESPIGRSIFVSMANGSGNSGYVPDDSAFGQQTFEVLSSRCKPGYAESAIVNGLLDLIAELKR